MYGIKCTMKFEKGAHHQVMVLLVSAEFRVLAHAQVRSVYGNCGSDTDKCPLDKVYIRCNEKCT
jgi:hypothetical protein